MFRKFGVTLILIVLGLLIFQTAYADLDAQQRQRVYYSVKPAVVLVWLSVNAQITIQTEQGPFEMQTQMSSSGSGWIISSDGYLVTNGHVVDTYHENNDEQLKGQMLWRALEQNVFPVVEQQQGRTLSSEEKVARYQQYFSTAEIYIKKDLDVYLQNWKKYPAEVKEFSPPMSGRPGKTSIPWESWETGKDVAILKIEGRDLPTVRIGDSGSMQIGAAVHVAGYPGVVMDHTYLNPESILEASFTRGQVSSLKLDVKGSNVIQIDAPITWGNSGGPVLADNGEVIGMATFISIHQGQQAIQGFNFAVPSNVVMEFVRAAGVDTSPSLFDRTWVDALELYYGGKSKDAIAKFTEVLRLMPDLQDAIKLQREAMSGGGEGGDNGGLSATTLIIGLIVILGIGLIVIGILRSRSSGGGASAPKPKKSKAGSDLGQLIVQAGPLQGNSFPVTTEGIRIGRDPVKCRIVINEETVSREHAIVYVDDNGAIMVKNLSGTNPTHVNERSIQETILQPGDTIKVGNSIMLYKKG